jgi:hypothetical protein
MSERMTKEEVAATFRGMSQRQRDAVNSWLDHEKENAIGFVCNPLQTDQDLQRNAGRMSMIMDLQRDVISTSQKKDKKEEAKS